MFEQPKPICEDAIRFTDHETAGVVDESQTVAAFNTMNKFCLENCVEVHDCPDVTSHYSS